MGAFKDLFNSERGLLAVLILVSATVLCTIGKLTIGDWQTFVQVVFGTYVAGKTVTGVASIIKNPPSGMAAAQVVEIVTPTVGKA